MRTPLIAGNWKMHGTVAEARDLATGLRRALETPEGVEVAVCPPFLHLAVVREALERSPIALGAQDVHWETGGAFTGEISPGMLREAGCRYVIVGHSERRHVMGESDEMVAKKVRAVLGQELTPILCVGELLGEREKGITEEVVRRQVMQAIQGLEAPRVGGMVIAYEPVWAIGTGKTATPEMAQEVHAFIRSLLAKEFGTATAGKVRIQYGGSVKPDNIRGLMAQADIDGALVGGASLEVHSFNRIVRYKE